MMNFSLLETFKQTSDESLTKIKENTNHWEMFPHLVTPIRGNGKVIGKPYFISINILFGCIYISQNR